MFIKKGAKVKIRKKNAIAIISITFICCVIAVGITILSMLKKETYASTVPEIPTETSNLTSNFDMMNILEENTKKNYTDEFIVEEKTLEYITTYEDNPNLPKGMIQVLQEGRDGLQEVITKKAYINNVQEGEEESSSRIIIAPINKIVQVGTGKYKSNYKVKVGDTLYVTSDTLGVMCNPSQTAEKLLTIHKDAEVKLLEIQKEWYKISYNIYTGYCPSNCLTYLKPNSLLQQDEGIEGTYTKEQLLSRLSFNMELNKPSGLTLEQFKQALSGHTQDKNKIFENNAEYFYYIEKQYNVNGIFVAAVGIHESGWGTSSICLDKRNLFGYGAYDRNPYGNAYSYNTYSESIDLIARVFAKYYLNPAGTSIYDGQVASGVYYNGPTLTGVNTRYATDKNWANAVYNWMKTLYKQI